MPETVTVYVRQNDVAPYDLFTEEEAHSAYDDMLDEVYEWPTIAGLSFSPAAILRECDPIAYRTYFNDWADGEFDEYEIPLPQFLDGDNEWIDNWIDKERGNA